MPEIAHITNAIPQLGSDETDSLLRKPVPPAQQFVAESSSVVDAGAPHMDDPELPWLRIRREIKVPVACVLFGGMLLILATLSWRDSGRHAILFVVGASVVTICNLLLMAYTYARQQPIVELQQRISQLKAGDPNPSVSFAHRNDEIRALGRNCNQMVQQLRESRQEIEHLYRTQMTRAEHLATLGEMAAGLAHEIRNPLAGIAGVIEIISRDLPTSSPARAVVKDVRQEIARINHILTDLLQTARPHPLRVRKSDLNTTVEHAVMLGRQQALTKTIDIRFVKELPVLEVEHDSDQIHQVLLNLLLNALQAIEKTGTITVTVKNQGSAAEVEVTDTGRGIAPKNLPNIFRPFFTTKGNGTGLGLSLARRIVEDHHGRIVVTSTVGKGTTFAVLLPMK